MFSSAFFLRWFNGLLLGWRLMFMSINEHLHFPLVRIP